MKRSKYTDEQIAHAIQESRLGVPTSEILRKFSISQATFYSWKRRFGDLEASEIKQLRQLEDENRRLKALVADLSLDKRMLQEVLSKKD